MENLNVDVPDVSRTAVLGREDPSILPLAVLFGEEVDGDGREKRELGCETEQWTEVYKTTDTD